RAGATFVEVHVPTEGGHPFEVVPVLPALPGDLDVLGQRGYRHDRDRPVPEHLVGEADITTSGIPRRRHRPHQPSRAPINPDREARELRAIHCASASPDRAENMTSETTLRFARPLPIRTVLAEV